MSLLQLHFAMRVFLVSLLFLVVSTSSSTVSRKTTEFGRCSSGAATATQRRPVTSHWLKGHPLPCASRNSSLSVYLGSTCVITCVRVVDELRGGVSSAVSLGGGVVDPHCVVLDVSAPPRHGFCFRVDVYSNCSHAAIVVRQQRTISSTCCCY